MEMVLLLTVIFYLKLVGIWDSATKTLTITDDLLIINDDAWTAIYLPSGSTIILAADLEIISYSNYGIYTDYLDTPGLQIYGDDTEEIHQLTISANARAIYSEEEIIIGSEKGTNISLDLTSNKYGISSSQKIYINVLGDIITSTTSNAIVGGNIILQGDSISINAGENGIYALGDVSLTSNNTTINAVSNDIYLADDENDQSITINGILILPNNDNSVEENEELIESYGFLGDGIIVMNGYQFTTNGVALSHDIFVEDSENGSILVDEDTIDEAVSVYEGKDLTITIAPNEGYQISEVYIDEELVIVDDNSYTFENVTEDHTIEVIYEKLTYTLDVEQEGEGTVFIAYCFGNVIEYGEDITIYFEPSTNYEITNVFIDGEEIEAATTYTLENISDNHTIKVVFGEIIIQNDESDTDDKSNENNASEEETVDTSDNFNATLYATLILLSIGIFAILKKESKLKNEK